MNGIALLLAQLLAADTIAAVQDSTDVAGVLAKRRADAIRLVSGWIAELPDEGKSRWAVHNGELKEAYRALLFLVKVPTSIDQADFGFCGPAALIAMFFTYFPNHMARLTRDLLINGSGRLGNITLPATAQMQAVTKGDWPRVVEIVDGRRIFMPQPLDWMLMAVIQYALTNDEMDVAGLNATGGASPNLRIALLAKTGLAKGAVFVNFTRLDLDHTVLVTKKDHPLREVLLSVEAKLLEGGSVSRLNFADHVVWLRSYAHVGTDVDLTYFTWGASQTQRYRDSDFITATSGFTTFTMEINAAD